MFLGLGQIGHLDTCMEIERKLMMNMEYGGAAAFTTPPNTTTYGNFSTTTTTTTTDHHAAAMEMDFMDELLFEGCWLETTRSLVNDPSPYYLPTLDSNNNINNVHHHQQIYQEDPTVGTSFPDQSESILVDGTELGRRWWIGPRANPGPSSSVKERLMLAVGYLRECTKNMNVLLQLWVPAVRRGGGGGSRYFLTPTQDQQPYYRNVCRAAYQMAVEEEEEEDMEESGGLPGRVFMGKLPDQCTPPDVRFFKREEYPRMNYSQPYDVRGSLALPVFERGTGTCLGVVEIVTATQKINYRPELEHVCQALEAVDLRSSQYFSPPGVKASHEELYHLALAEIIEVLASVCKTHRLPLALTWAPCYQQGKGSCPQYSNENYAQCVSTVDTACFVADVDVFGFHEACSEYHLFRGQGTVGTAFTTAKPCFASDITAFSKAEYPLSHHARMFGLRAAVAIPLRSIYCTGSADFVLEFFLPKDCQDTEEQKQMLNSLSIVLQQACRSLHAVIDKEEEEIIYPVNKEVVVPSDHLRINKEESQKSGSSPQKDQDQSSWIAHMMEAQQKGKGVSISLEYLEEEANEEFKVTTHWDNINTQGGSRNGQAFPDFGQLQQSSESKGSVEGGGDSYSYSSRRSSGGRKSGEKRRTKTEKTISLPVLRQYFAGSLKDAAKSIGVCPTTLKRICRQHGITRWPSRKIKKVGHSLRKLQLVIDSVQGAEGAIQIGSFYSNFPELSSPGTSSFSSLKMSENSKQSNTIPESSGLFTPSKSPPSSCSQTSGPSIFCATAANHQQHTTTTINALSSADTLMRENPGGILQMASSEADLHALHQYQQEPNLLHNSTCSLDTIPVLPESSSHNSRDGGAFRVKATFGDEKTLFSFHPNWTFGDLQMEIGRRFNLDDISRIDLKYLDDDREWVLLTCDADFQECIEIYRASQSHTIRLCLQHASSNPNLGSPFGSSGLS